ncbi:hypothetical protein, partial [Candidatus Thiosymbion oneisti]|uniref:hypothetical protein n=1 Tax=Candidatus Thiosymbion oneisti TaxID=589554 RepID=UPI001C40500A
MEIDLTGNSRGWQGGHRRVFPTPWLHLYKFFIRARLGVFPVVAQFENFMLGRSLSGPFNARTQWRQ